MTQVEWMDQVQDPAVRKALRFLYETHPDRPPARVDACGRCGHRRDEHRANDGGPPPDRAEFRCVFPGFGPPVRLCDCRDWVDSTPA